MPLLRKFLAESGVNAAGMSEAKGVHTQGMCMQETAGGQVSPGIIPTSDHILYSACRRVVGGGDRWGQRQAETWDGCCLKWLLRERLPEVCAAGGELDRWSPGRMVPWLSERHTDVTGLYAWALFILRWWPHLPRGFNF